MNDTDDITEAQRLHSDVLAHLDGTGGDMDSLANALHAAGEAGWPIESHDDRRADIDNALQRAFDAVDDTDPDAEEVLEWVESAESSTGRFYSGLPEEMRAFPLPDYVDSGVYDTLGDYAEYVRRDILSLLDKTEKWVEADDE